MTERPFAEPWEAQVFAIVASLQDSGLFTRTEWAEALGAEASRTGGASDYAAWLAAVETLLAERGIAAPETLSARQAAWARAAAATPHGQPIVLANDPAQ